jgi:hypothetical protein
MRTKLKLQRKLAVNDPGSPGNFLPRVWERKDGSLLVKCGCCDNKVEVFSFHDKGHDSIEINGVLASREEWARLLEFKKP